MNLVCSRYILPQKRGEVEPVGLELIVECSQFTKPTNTLYKFMKNCLQCNNLFSPEPREVARGYGKFCCLKCSCIYNGNRRKKDRTPNVTCAMCHSDFYKNPYQIKKSKSGLVFCTPACKGQAQKIGGIVEVQPEHYGTSEHYRKLAFKHYPNKCEICEYAKFPDVLEVHHRDNDHQNNTIVNLAILCPTCHVETHFISKTGKWAKKT